MMASRVKKLGHGRRFLGGAVTGIVLACSLCGGAESGDLATVLGEPFYTGHIIPTPQKCRLLSSELCLADAGSRKARAAILVSPNPQAAIRWGVENFARRIARAAELVEFPIQGWDGSDAPPELDAYVAVGLAGDAGFSKLAGYDDAWEKESEPENCYHIRPTRIRNRPGLLVVGKDPRGALYGLASLAQLVRARGDRIVLRECRIDDWPEFAMRSLSHSEPSAGLVPFIHWMVGYKLNQLTINYYENWQRTRPYYYEAMEALGEEAKDTGIFELGQIVNPYDWRYHPEKYKIRVSKQEDVERLIEQFRISLDAGGRFIMLAADDFVDVVNGEFALTAPGDRLRFFDLADAHIYLVNKVYHTLKPECPSLKMAFCSPYYATRHEEFVRRPEIVARYLRKLGKGLDRDIGIIWTGPQVTSFAFTDEDMDYYQGLVGRKTMQWDNTAWRAATWRFLCFPGDQYPPDLADRSFLRGFYLNMRVRETYKPFCVTVADYLWNPKAYSGERSIHTAMRSIYGETIARTLEAWASVYNEILEIRNRPGSEATQCFAQLVADLTELRDRVAKDAPMFLSTFDEDVARQRFELEALENLPSITCPSADKSPQIDGIISAGEWDDAVVFPQLQDISGKGAEVLPTTARMLRVGGTLYFAFECVQDPKVQHTPPVTTHDGNVFMGDAAEIFLDPLQTRAGHYHFVVSSLGTRFDEEQRGLGLGATKWNPEWEAAVQPSETGWTLEVKIPPFAGPEDTPRDESVWGLNLCRGYYEGSQLSCWSPTLGKFNNTRFYGTCRF